MPLPLMWASPIGMSILLGYIDSNGHPNLTIRVSGAHPSAAVVVEATIDTGFTDFVMLPLVHALPLGLPLYGTVDYTLADGSKITNFVAEGTVTVLPPNGRAQEPEPLHRVQSVTGAVVPGGDSALLGMEFIRGLNKLMVGKTVVLIDNSLVDETLLAAVKNPEE